MTIPSGAICVPALVATILSSLAYYKLDPERRILCVPFALLAGPAAVLICYLIARIARFDGPIVSVVALLLALGFLGGSVWHAKCLLPKARVS